MARPPVNPNPVDWSGENPGITLKATVDGETTCLVSFFRVVVSPHGAGHAAFVLTDPLLKGTGEAVNTCFTDNEPLARYLLSDFVRFFGAWRGIPALDQLTYTTATSFTHGGDQFTAWTETIAGPGVDVTLSWKSLQKPFLVEYLKEQSATGKHEMFSLFVPALDAEVVANGVRGTGVVGPRDVFGTQSSMAFLAFSETWLNV
ncbi:MAG TPA: hypothetical protein VFH48_29995 [Chloroflexota bacterium]|nr:hypothetical protein [Chloroflexota bacterium]